ncbi:MAG: protein-L-isoaspartate O-methyltransferase, partial [Cohaesibacteraceae bacterium]
MPMTEQRVKMVDNQLRPFDVSNYQGLAAVLDIPRELFVPENKRALANSDAEIDIRDGALRRPMIRPMHRARRVQAAHLHADRVV